MAHSDVRFVGFGAPEANDIVLQAMMHCSYIGAETSYVTCDEDDEFASFDHGTIDWRGLTNGVHWLVNSSNTVLAGESPRFAWGAGMTIGELEGARVVMVVDIPVDASRLDEAWGAVIERIRQIHILFLTPRAIEAITELEQISAESLLLEIRKRGMVPHVCTYFPDERRARVEHALGSVDAQTERELMPLEWLARFLCNLPSADSSNKGIESAAIE